MNGTLRRLLVQRAAEPYRSSGRFAWYFARGKLWSDPAYTAILEHALISQRANVLDIGCGRGLLAAWLLAANEEASRGNYPIDWPAPPNPVSIHGLDLNRSDIEVGRAALGNRVRFTLGDLCSTDFGRVDAVVALDVLHYVDFKSQEDVLRRIHAAILPGGVLILRVGDAGKGLRSALADLTDRIVLLLRGQNSLALYCRTLDQWLALLERVGFNVSVLPHDQGMLYANVMLIASPDSSESRGNSLN